MLLLDEPTNALDLRAQRELRETLRRLARQGTGLLLVTHHLPDVLPEIDRVILMRGGRIESDGPRRDLLTPARLGALFGMPIDVVERDDYLHALA
jgi:iron complex transport system ATP-binding protein